MKDIFFSSPIGRLAFLGRYVLSIILMMAGVFATDSPMAGILADIFASVLFFSGAIYMCFYAIVPRLVSVGLSKYLALLVLIPMIYPLLFLFFVFCPAGQFVKHDTVA